MKKLITLLLALIFSLSILIGCGKQEEPQMEEETTTEEVTPEEGTEADTMGEE